MKFAFKPGEDFFTNRSAGDRRSSLSEAASARSDAEAERDRIKAALADSDTEAARIIEEARQSADVLAADIADRARARRRSRA